MSEWMSKSLGELLGDKGYIRGPFGSSLKRGEMKKSGIPVYEQLHAIYNTREFRFFIDDHKFKELERFQVKSSDLIISCSGTVGKISIIDERDPKGIISQALLILRPKVEFVRPIYLKYFLTSELGQYHLLSASHGSVQPNIAERKIVQQIPIEVPSVEEQDKIIEVLSSLDDKIDLLHRQNKTLELMAETLFRQWFVEEAEDNWEEIRLDQIATIQNGYAFKSGEYIETEFDAFEVFKMGHISPEGGLKSSPKKDFVPRNSNLNKWVLKKRDIVLAMTDMKDNVVILGVPALVDKDEHYVLNQRVARIVLKPMSKIIDQVLLYYYMSDPEFIATLQSKASSGVQVNLSTESIRESILKIAPIIKQEKIVSFLVDITEKQEKGRKQIKLLEKLRDSLLPKLMNGTIRVSNQ